MKANKPYIHLNDIPKESFPFTIPDGYFSTLGDEIEARIQHHDLPDSSIASTPKPPFTLPDNYFSQLTEDIVRKTESLDKETQTATTRWFTPWVITGSVAAAVILLLLFSGLFEKQSSQCTEPLACLEVSEADYNMYIEHEIILEEDLLNEQEIMDEMLTTSVSIDVDAFLEESIPIDSKNTASTQHNDESSTTIDDIDFEFEITEDDLEDYIYDFETL